MSLHETGIGKRGATNPEGNPWNAVEELDRLLQAADGFKSGSLTPTGLWHYAEIARHALNALKGGSATDSASAGAGSSVNLPVCCHGYYGGCLICHPSGTARTPEWRENAFAGQPQVESASLVNERRESQTDHGASAPARSPASFASAETEPLPNRWQPVIVSAFPGEPIPAAAAWLYEPSCGVRLGSFGRFSDGVAFGSVPGMNGCFVRDWGATHWQPANIPAPPEASK